jgi:hypothetical protein
MPIPPAPRSPSPRMRSPSVTTMNLSCTDTDQVGRQPQKKLRAKRGQSRREIMKTTLLAAAAALSLGIGSAYASEGGQVANTFFTSLPGGSHRRLCRTPKPLRRRRTGRRFRRTSPSRAMAHGCSRPTMAAATAKPHGEKFPKPNRPGSTAVSFRQTARHLNLIRGPIRQGLRLADW